MSIVSAIAVPHPPLIVPAVGRGQEERIQATVDAYRQAAQLVVDSKPDCLIVTSPHAPMFRDGFHITTDAKLVGSMARFNAPHERLEASCDVDLAREILRRANGADIPSVGSERYRDDMDHGTYVPLYFIREAFRSASDSNQDSLTASRKDEGHSGRGHAIGFFGHKTSLEKQGAAAGNGDALPAPIVRIGLSGLSPSTHRALGRIIADAAEALGRRIAFVASGDLSHKLLPEGPYGYAPEGPVFDQQIGEIFESGNLEGLFAFDEDFCEAAAECGLRSFQIMAGALDGLAVECKLLSNEGPFGVGYGVALVTPSTAENQMGSVVESEAKASPAGQTDEVFQTDTENEIDPCIALARLSVETYVRTGRPAKLPPDVPRELLDQRAGAFVSLHEHGELRGCIGTIAATKSNVAEEILANGISACSRDPRFDPVRPDELDYLEYSVDILGDAEPISSPAELDVKRYGVIVTKGWKRGLLLPNLDGVDTIDYQVEIAKRKAGIHPADNDVDLERFEVVRHTRGGEPRK